MFADPQTSIFTPFFLLGPIAGPVMVVKQAEQAWGKSILTPAEFGSLSGPGSLR
jgi:hypothetical protein